MNDRPRRLAIMADGSLNFYHGKTATSILRYRPSDVAVVIDRQHAGRTTQEAVGLGGAIPIVEDIDHALAYHPNAFLLGIAVRGGVFPPSWRNQILTAIRHGLDVINGLHVMLHEDPEFVRSAEEHGVRLIDVRDPTIFGPMSDVERRPAARVITFVGSDCAVGKKTAALELTAAARQSGRSAAFVATGQTGIMLSGRGVCVDRVIGKEMARAVGRVVAEASQEGDWVFVEGQGSLLHPGYSGVTMALLHGSAPDALILVHVPNQRTIGQYPVPIPPLPRLIEIHERAAGWVKPTRVVALALNTRELDQAETARAIADAEQATGLPAADPVKGGSDKLFAAVERALATDAADDS